MILLLTSEYEENVNSIIENLESRGYEWQRINSEKTSYKNGISIDFNSNEVSLNGTNLNSVGAVYCRKWGRFGINKWQSAVAQYRDEIAPTDFAISDTKHIYRYLKYALNDRFWLNRLDNFDDYINRLIQMAEAKRVGFKIPNSIVTQSYDELTNFYSENDGNIITKVTGQIPASLQSMCYTTKVEEDFLELASSDLPNCPTLFQSYVDKKYEIRSTVVGDKIFSAIIDSQSHDLDLVKFDWRYANADTAIYPVELPDKVNTKILNLMKSLKLDFGAIDLILTHDDEYYFLEVNPEGQWGWIEVETGLQITNEIVEKLVYEDQKRST